MDSTKRRKVPLTLEQIKQKQEIYFNSELAAKPAIYVTEEFYDNEEDGYYGGEVKCVYRNNEGRKCAVGCTIPDKLYKKEWDVGDGKPVDMLSMKVLNYLGASNEEILYYLKATQAIHDDVAKSRAFGVDEHFGKAFLARLKEVEYLKPEFFFVDGYSPGTKLYDMELNFS